jgi:hypothetical protein
VTWRERERERERERDIERFVNEFGTARDARIEREKGCGMKPFRD